MDGISDDLIARLRALLANQTQIDISPYVEEAEKLQAEVERLRTRLEINAEAPDYDGIACRDETIRLQDIQLAGYRARDAEVASAKQDAEYAWKNTQAIEAHYVAADKKQREQVSALQAKIDELMLEYCPDEITPDQLEAWGKNQQPV